jgi:NAD(P)-dependent dehydrogenase (short-subunit alcohol dehydrogenase family)
MPDMAGKVALVTGAGAGLGKAVASQFAARGAQVVAAEINAEMGAAVAEEIPLKGGEAFFSQTDISIEADMQRLVEASLSSLGRLDFAVNNAAIEGEVLPLLEQRSEVMQRVIAVDLIGVFFGLKYQIAALLKQGGGSIVSDV